MPKIKKPKSKVKYNEGGFTALTQAGNISPMGAITSVGNLATGLKSTIGNWDESTKTQKASGVINAAGDAVGTLKAIPGIGTVLGGVGEAALKTIGSIVNMFPGKDGKKQARDDANEQTRLSRFQSGTMFSKHGGNMDTPSTEYKILPSNKSKKTAPIQKLSKNMEIVSQKGTFSHNSNDDIPVDTNNDNQEDLRMEGGEIILKQKDGGQYMLNKQVSKVLKPKALALAKGDKISQNTLEKYLKPNAIKANDANLAQQGLTDRISTNSALGGTMVSGKKYANGNGGNIEPTTKTVNPVKFKTITDTIPQNKTFIQGSPEYNDYMKKKTLETVIKTGKGAEVRKSGGTIKAPKYFGGGINDPESLVKDPTAISGFYNTPKHFDPTKPQFNPPTTVPSNDFYSTYKTNKSFNDLQFNSEYNKASKIKSPKSWNLLKNGQFDTSQFPNKDRQSSSKTSASNTGTGTNSSREKLTSGEIVGLAGLGAGIAAKSALLRKNKSLPIDSSRITNELRRKQGKAEDLIYGAENESIQRVQGSVNKALDSTSYPSVQARLANARNAIKAGSSAESQGRSDYVTRLAGLKSQNASTLAGMESQNYYATNDRRQQEIDKRTQAGMDITQDAIHGSLTTAKMMNDRKYRDDVKNPPMYWNGSSWVLGTKPEESKFGGKIKKPKRIR